MKTNWKSSSLRNMSDTSLKEIYRLDSGTKFSEIKKDLWKVLRCVEKMEKGIATKKDEICVDLFGRSWGGYDQLFVPLSRREYKKAIGILKKELKEVKEHQNIARKKWGIATGVKTELRRRGLNIE